MKDAKKIISTIFTILVLSTSVSYGQNTTPRDIIAVPGHLSISAQWSGFLSEIKVLQPKGYVYRNLYSSLPSITILPSSQQATAISSMISNPGPNQQSGQNVLGLGHDVGGLALRGASDIDNRLTALILVGTPNNGSFLLQDILNGAGDGNVGGFELLLKNLQAQRGSAECPNCNKVDNLQRMINAMKINSAALENNANNINGYYNGVGAPANTVSIWGNAGTQTINQLIGAQGGSESTSNVNLQECANKLQSDLKDDIKNEQVRLQVNKVTGFLSFISSLFTNVGTIVTPEWKEKKGPDGNTILDPITKAVKLFQVWPGVGVVLSTITSFITAEAQKIRDNIDALKVLDKKKADLLKCELFDALLEAQWRIKVVQNQGTLEFSAVNAKLCEELTYKLDNYSGSDAGEIRLIRQKNAACAAINSFIPEPSDLVYTKSEQILTGKPFYEIAANHYQEQKWSHNSNVLAPLFDGTAQGLAYKIPKQQ
jgi:hypothetical protein